MTASQQVQGQQANKNGKIQKSQSLQKGIKAKQQSRQLKSLKNFQFSSNLNKAGGDSNENAENENSNEKNNQFGLGNSNANILNIQFNPSSTLNRIQDNELDMKKQLANIRLPKLSAAPLSGKAKDKNQKNQQKLNNFVDSHMGSTENGQEDDKNTSKKNEKDPDLERIKDRFKQYKNSKDITNFFDQKSGTPPSENQNPQSAGSNVTQQNQAKETSKKDEELNKIYGGGGAAANFKSLRSNTPKQNGSVLGLKANASAPSLQIIPQTTSASIQQSFLDQQPFQQSQVQKRIIFNRFSKNNQDYQIGKHTKIPATLIIQINITLQAITVILRKKQMKNQIKMDLCTLAIMHIEVKQDATIKGQKKIKIILSFILTQIKCLIAIFSVYVTGMALMGMTFLSLSKKHSQNYQKRFQQRIQCAQIKNIYQVVQSQHFCSFLKSFSKAKSIVPSVEVLLFVC
ncbi:hypothetical protein ABPG72_020512 [Tetrahymena utriculariae]